MKNKISLAILLFYSASAFSQAGTNSIAMSNEFGMLAAHGGVPTSFATFQTYSSNQVDGTQFFLPDWSKGEVTLNDKEVFNNGILLAYDKVRQELFIKQKDAADILLGTKENINTFSLKDAVREYSFVNSAVFSNVKPEVYYQVLAGDMNKLSLLKYTKTSFVKADKTDMMKQKEGNVYDAFVDKVTYYISKGKAEPVQIQFKTKSLKKIFADLNININKYISDHPESINEDYMISMVEELNK